MRSVPILSSQMRSTRSVAVVIAIGLVMHLSAQIPTKCFEIESILVDACTSGGQCTNAAEGQNEMVRFITGPNDIALTDLTVDWPNNSFNGFVQNATTATITAELNLTVQSCGYLLEPVAGIIPAGKRVLMVTSTEMCVQANSFADLADTLYLIFQAPGNTAGHFANHNNGGTISATPSGASALRTLVMTYLPNSCGDTATYDRAQLLNIYGTYGGAAPENDGATARFSWPGIPAVTYLNQGCQAPFVPLAVEIFTSAGTIACGESIALEGSVSGGSATLTWSGGMGVFTAPNDTATLYIPEAGEVGSITLYLCAVGACAEMLCDSVVLTITGAPVAQIAPNGPLALCDGDGVLLTASGGDAYGWNTGDSVATISVDDPGTYTVIVSNTCGADTASITIIESLGPTAVITGDTILCPGGSATLMASGGTSYAWSTGPTTASITVDQPGVYTVTVSNDCGSDQATVTMISTPMVVNAIASPSIGPAPLEVNFGSTCAPTAVGWLWDLDAGAGSGEEAPVFIYTEPGTYQVDLMATSANGCTGTGSITIVVTDAAPTTVILPNVFSPNGDGVNDAFVPVVYTGNPVRSTTILNRWGQTVYTVSGPPDWDGRSVSRQEVAEGTYYWVLDLDTTVASDVPRSGVVTLLR